MCLLEFSVSGAKWADDVHQTGVVVGEIPLGADAIKRGQAFISAAFSADGPSLLTGNSDRSLQLWDANNLTELARWTVPECDPWKPTGKAIATVSFGKENNQYFTIASNGFVHKRRLKTHLALRSNDRHKKPPCMLGVFTNDSTMSSTSIASLLLILQKQDQLQRLE